MKHSQAGRLLRRVLTLALALLFVISAFPAAELPVAEAETRINIPMKISISGLTYPTTIKHGDSFALKGEVSVNYGTITKITAVVKNRNTKKTVQSATSYPKTRKVNIRSTINKKVIFGKLATGSYNLKVTAYAKSGKKTAHRVIINRNFNVKDGKPKLSITGEKYPSSITKGNKAPLRGVIHASEGKITNVWAYVLNGDGKRVMSATYKPNKSFFNLEYTVNTAFTFGVLSKGNFTYQVIAKAVNGKSYTTKTLINAPFVVK